MKNEVVKFVNGSLELEVKVSPDENTVWLNRNQIAKLFDRDVKTIGKHINNALEEELDNSTVAKFATVQNEGNRQVTRDIEYYNLDVIISVGYRVKSQNGIIFRKWAISILKDYLIKGYSINQKRLDALNKTVLIQTRMLASALNIEENDVLRAINLYTEGLSLLDDYDHQEVSKPKGNKAAGCKRIGASIFLDFLDKNGRLIVDNKQVISNSALVAITLLVAESRADEKDIIVKLIMNFLVNAD